MATPEELLAQALAKFQTANRIDGSRNSFKKDSPLEYQSVVAYLNGGSRPQVASDMGVALALTEDARRALGVIVEPEPEPEPTPTSAKLRWKPPALTSPLVKVAGGIGTGAGQDLRMTPASLSGSMGQIVGYNDVEMIGGAILGGTAGSNGHIVPRENTGTFHLEGWKIALTREGDALTVRWRQPILQIQNCWIEVTKATTSFHSDGFQTQEAEIDELRVDRCTIKTDYQGIFMSNEVSSRTGGRSKVTKTILSRLLFMKGTQGSPASYFFKAFPPRAGTDPLGVTEMYDVWAPDPPICYPWTSFSAWSGGSMKHGSFLIDKKHANGSTYKFLKFSTTQDTVPTGTYKGQACEDCGVRGDGGIWVGAPPASLNVGCDSNVGVGYASPGYL